MTHIEYLQAQLEEAQNELKGIENQIEDDYQEALENEEELTREDITEYYEDKIEKTQRYIDELENKIEVAENETAQAEAFADEFGQEVSFSFKSSSAYIDLEIEQWDAVINYLTENGFEFELKNELAEMIEDEKEEFQVRFSNHQSGGKFCDGGEFLSYNEGDIFVWYK